MAIIFYPSGLLICGVLFVGTAGMFRRRRRGFHDIIFCSFVTKSRS